MLINKPILIAKEILSKSTDVAHALDHHRRVAENCELITKTEKLQVSNDLIMIAAWWHDLESRTGKTTLLKSTLNSLNFDENTIDQIAIIISEHSFGQQQTSDESRVLYDADKLEWTNATRMSDVLLHDSKEVKQKYHETWIKNIFAVRETLHFEIVKKLFDNSFEETKLLVDKFVN
ncbi:MAG: hypothetical protein COU65_00055 [Candidatus Pacebacteria bacterium CG10_big_fil_rev_8_21_14_0_10_42_12]|nr:MAG: hypothetical protein COU65_00055 [Candidatus Pacebacteria bacterium CG10_big_fil_rev_8_21_14_0_10_42_12]